MQRFFDVVQTRTGDAIPNAAVTVYNEAGSLATLYSDNGVTQILNPTTTNADGEYTFFASNGRYSINIYRAGYVSETRDGIILFDPENADWSSFNGIAKISGGNTFVNAQAVVFASLSDNTNISVNANASNHFLVTLGGNRTLDNPTNLVDGVILNFWVKQDGTGSRTLSYGSMYKWPSGTAPTLTTTAGALDLIIAQYNASLGILACSITKDIR